VSIKELKDARIDKGLSQQELANLLGVAQNTVSALETGKILPSDELRKHLKEIFGEVLYLREVLLRNEPRRIVTSGNAIVPFYRHVVKAGNGGHVLEDETVDFDIAEHYANTAVYEVSGDSMIDDDIETGDRVVVKLGLRFNHRGDTLLVRYNNELMVKGARFVDGVLWLIPSNKKFPPWQCRDGDEVHIIGRVIEVIKDPRHEAARKFDPTKLKGEK